MQNVLIFQSGTILNLSYLVIVFEELGAPLSLFFPFFFFLSFSLSLSCSLYLLFLTLALFPITLTIHSRYRYLTSQIIFLQRAHRMRQSTEYRTNIKNPEWQRPWRSTKNGMQNKRENRIQQPRVQGVPCLHESRHLFGHVITVLNKNLNK